MQELRLVAVSEDGTYLVLATAGRGTRFTLPVDDRLRAAVRGHFSRLGQFEIEVESPLRPKEIQARIRSGETAEEIAESAGIPVERVRWFEGPVLQEREYMAQQAQRVAVRRPGESTPGPPLGETVEERLGRGGVDLEEVEWDSWKCEDGTWRVRLSFFDNGRPHAAEWTFDPRRRHVFPLDEVAARLTAVEWDDDTLSDTVTPLVPRRPAMKVVSNDRDPTARSLPADPEQPGAPGLLRPAEPREYIAEPRPPFRDPSETTHLREAAHRTAAGRDTTRYGDPPEDDTSTLGPVPRQETAQIRDASGEHRAPRPRETGEPRTDRDTPDFLTATDEREAGEPHDATSTGRSGDLPQDRGAAYPDEEDEARTDRDTPDFATATGEREAGEPGDMGGAGEPHPERDTTRAEEAARVAAAAGHGGAGGQETSGRGTDHDQDAQEQAVAQIRDASEDRATAGPRETGGAGTHESGATARTVQTGEPGDAPETDPYEDREDAPSPATGEPREAVGGAGTGEPREAAEAGRPRDDSQDRGDAHSRETGEPQEPAARAEAGEARDTVQAEAGQAHDTAETAHAGDETGESSGAAGEREAPRFADTPARRAARSRDTGAGREEEKGHDAQAPAGVEAKKSGTGSQQRRGKDAEDDKPARESKTAAQRPGQRQPARTPAKKKPAARPTMPAAAQDKPATGPPAAGAPVAAANGEPTAPQRSARRRKSKGKRASVPSWDEIMFGARRPD